MITYLTKKAKDERGAVAIMTAVSLVMFIGLAAVAVDLSHLFVARNELQNAADGGALAGAAVLYSDDGTAVNPGANQTARDTAVANKSEKSPVEVDGNDVQRGHWCFSCVDPATGKNGLFTPNEVVLTPPDLWNRSTPELDVDTDFINAVKVTARRQTTPVASFFARIFGYQDFAMSAQAVAYIGYAGTLKPHDANQPIAICKQSILNGSDEYDCNVGRMINSGGNDTTHNTGGWTNFTQPCQTANAPTVKPLIDSGNPIMIQLGDGVGSTGGMDDAIFKDFYKSWLDTNGGETPVQPWNMTLPVIDCSANNVSNCATIEGAVNINIIWIAEKANDPAPRAMADWTCPAGSTDAQCWTSFVDHFHLKDVDNNPPAYAKKSIYFLPDCTRDHIPKGRTGGENFGVLAKIPVLVK